MTTKKSEDKGRRSGAERRMKYIAPYMDFVYNGEEKRSDEERRKKEDRRNKPRDKEKD